MATPLTALTVAINGTATGLVKAAGLGVSALGSLTTAAGGTVAAIGAITAAGGAIVAGAGLVTVLDSIKEIDRITKKGRTLGLDPNTVRALGDVAAESGVQVAQLEKGALKLFDSIAEAKTGKGEALGVLRELFGGDIGISRVAMGTRRQQLIEYSKALGAVADDGVRLRGITEVLGVRMADLGNAFDMIAGGALARFRKANREAGRDTNKRQQFQAEDLLDNFVKLGVMAKGVADIFAKELLPTFQDLSGEAVKFARSADFRDSIEAAGKATAQLIEDIRNTDFKKLFADFKREWRDVMDFIDRAVRAYRDLQIMAGGVGAAGGAVKTAVTSPFVVNPETGKSGKALEVFNAAVNLFSSKVDKFDTTAAAARFGAVRGGAALAGRP